MITDQDFYQPAYCNGKYTVKQDDKETVFHDLGEALKAYNEAEGEKALWDITHIPELLHDSDSQIKPINP